MTDDEGSGGPAKRLPEVGDPPLPPPAFPPGSRRQRPMRRSPRRAPAPSDPAVQEEGGGVPDDAFIDPDEPLVRTRPPRAPDDYEEVVGDSSAGPAGAGVAAAGGLRRSSMPTEPYGDVHLARLVQRVGRLADALREEGESALRTLPGMSGFEAELRAFCAGWLAGVREPDEM